MTLQRKDNTVFCAVCGGSWHFMHLPLAQLDCPAANCSANPQRGNGAVVAYIGFYRFDDAKDHRSKNGGWIFLSNDGVVTWFSNSFTPSQIFKHPVTNAQSGKLL